LTIYCDKKTFEGLKRRTGVHSAPPESLIAFCHKALAEDMGYLSELYIPDLNLNAAPLDDWFDFENWCDDLAPGLMHQVCGNEAYSETHLPRHFFNDSNALKTALLPKLMEQEDAFKYSCGVVEIQHNDEALVLVFTDLDSWNFECGDLFVTQTYDEITEELGFYKAC
jgi:hypothetical protein